jgi:hypothetical protein
MEIIKSEHYDIYKLDESIYKIQFRYTSYALINSLVKSKLIIGSSTDDNYRTIQFKANTVKTLKEYLDGYEIKKGKKKMLVSDIAKVIRSLVQQLSYLVNSFSTILGYNMEDIIVINDEKFAFLGSEFVAKIDPDTHMAMICCPFYPNDFFISPEILNITELPSYVHFKTSYFSMSCLIIKLLLDDDEFYIEYLKDKSPSKILNYLNNHPIRETKMYWLLSRCLVELPNNRSIILI